MGKLKNKNYAFRITERNLTTIQTKAKQSHMTVTDYLTTCGLGKKIVVLTGAEELSRQLKLVGNNLNQLTLLAHQGRITTVHLEETMTKLGEIHAILLALYEEVTCGGSSDGG